MRYFGFLARFVVFPIIVLRLLGRLDRRAGRTQPPELSSWPADKALLAHAAIAVAYTTVWDNYLVASGIWGYDRRLVSGVRLGWVPIEEYTFFVLQPLLTGSWLLWLSRRIPSDPPSAPRPRLRLWTTLPLAVLWVVSLGGLLFGGRRWRYMTLITTWALPPIMLQTAFGGDILWRHRRLITAAFVPASLYLGAADSVAIRAGTWNISPKQTVGVHVIPHLPLEEFVFFCLTNLLLIFGVTLVLSEESERRLPARWKRGYEQFKDRYIGSGR